MNLTNRAVEDEAIAFVIDHERQHGRAAHDTRAGGHPADIRSTGRVIEVKAYGGWARGQDLWLEPAQVAEAQTNAEFHLYLVENVRQGNRARFRIIDLHGDRLMHLIAGRRERRYFVVPMPVGEYDAAVSELECHDQP